ncbi:MAG: regulatory protein RecX [Proteobacteria bacterium]|nr:regulatory protein RecX [Pseudomonadota bacterium]
MIAIREQALRFLARREYSKAQLRNKLLAKGWDQEQIHAVLEDLASNKLQDDHRYTAVYIRHRIEAGYGPRRIFAELNKNGVGQFDQALMDENDPEWIERLKTVWQKKFKNKIPQDDKTKFQQIRFLLSRGFTPEQVKFLFTMDENQ